MRRRSRPRHGFTPSQLRRLAEHGPPDSDPVWDAGAELANELAGPDDDDRFLALLEHLAAAIDAGYLARLAA